MSKDAFDIPQDQIAAFCRRHGIARLSVYGSVLRDDFGPESDIDLLIEFLPEAQPSLLDLGGMQDELCRMLGRQVDLKTPEFLSPAIRQRVQREARVQYAA
jgi:predicted nucleotidyltransferase